MCYCICPPAAPEPPEQQFYFLIYKVVIKAQSVANLYSAPPSPLISPFVLLMMTDVMISLLESE